MGNTTVLMSSPEYFKVEYSINPWMVEGVSVNLELAKQQWENLKTTIEQAGASVEVVPPHEQYREFQLTLNLREEAMHLFWMNILSAPTA